jgi:outer membrane protein OmpA-like peptidoglycan-associated protein
LIYCTFNIEENQYNMSRALPLKQFITIAILVACLPVSAQVRSWQKGSRTQVAKTDADTTDTAVAPADSDIDMETFSPSQRSLNTAQKIVKAGLPVYSDDGAYVNRQVQYIRSAALLGDHFLAGYHKSHTPSDLQKAMKYYYLVTELSSGTDSDLGDNLKTITERNKVCRKVAVLFNNGTIPLESVKGIYARHAIDITKADFSGSFAGSLTSPSGATVKFVQGNAQLTAEAQAGIKGLAAELKNNTGKKVIVSSGRGNSYLAQQLSWEHVSVVVQLLMENGIDGSNIIFRYNDETGNLNETQIRFAAEDEEGPASLPPPAPGIWGN